MNTVGEAIRRSRKARRLSQDQLAEQADVNRSYLSEIERGANVSLDVLERLVRVLDMKEIPLSGKSVALIRGSDVDGITANLMSSALSEARRGITRAEELWDRVLAEHMSREGEIGLPPALYSVGAQPMGLTGIEWFIPPGASADAVPFDVIAERPDMEEFEVRGYVAAGQPLDEETHGETVRLPSVLVGETEYVIRARGESMIEWGVEDGDYVIVDRRHVAATGELIIAWLNDGITVKTWFNKRGRKILRSGNPDYPNYEIKPDDIFEIRGVVTGIVKSPPRISG